MRAAGGGGAANPASSPRRSQPVPHGAPCPSFSCFSRPFAPFVPSPDSIGSLSGSRALALNSPAPRHSRHEPAREGYVDKTRRFVHKLGLLEAGGHSLPPLPNAAPTPRHRGPADMEGRPAGCGPAGLEGIPILRVGTSPIDAGADCRYDGEQGARPTGPRLDSLTVDMRMGVHYAEVVFHQNSRSCPDRDGFGIRRFFG
jgi:hypothetical protein